MSLWAFIPAKHLQAVGSLPQSARRLDTGEVVDNLPSTGMIWARACGWWDLDNLDVPLLIQTNHLTPADVKALTVEVTAALNARQQRHNFVADAHTKWALAKDKLQDYVDAIPPPPDDPVLTLGLVGEQVTYLYHASTDLAAIVIGGFDVLMVMAAALQELLDRADGLVLPT